MKLFYIFLLPNTLALAHYPSLSILAKDSALQRRSGSGTLINQVESSIKLQKRGGGESSRGRRGRSGSMDLTALEAGKIGRLTIQDRLRNGRDASPAPSEGRSRSPSPALTTPRKAGSRKSIVFSEQGPNGFRPPHNKLGKSRPDHPTHNGDSPPPSLAERLTTTAAITGIGSLAGVAYRNGPGPALLAGTAVAATCIGACAAARLQDKGRVAEAERNDHPSAHNLEEIAATDISPDSPKTPRSPRLPAPKRTKY